MTGLPTPDDRPADRPTRAVLAEVHAERIRQDQKWGQQNHPTWFDGSIRDAAHYVAWAERWKRHNAERVAQRNAEGVPSDRNCAWDGVLREEVYEALAEADPAARRAELIQVAAVAVAMVEQIDREAAEARERTS
jgi:hypothetical protein